MLYDKEIQCACGETFFFTQGEQEYYAEKGFSEPKRCPECRAKKKAFNQKQERHN